MKQLLLFFISFIAFSATAQIAFNTGSIQLDSDLNEINLSASTNFESFKGDLAISYDISEKKIEFMRGSLNMVPGEIYLALEISKLSGTPLDEVNTIYQKNKSKGWGYIAKEAGIKPGSSEFHQLKNNASSKKNKSKNKNNGQKNKEKK